MKQLHVIGVCAALAGLWADLAPRRLFQRPRQRQ